VPALTVLELDHWLVLVGGKESLGNCFFLQETYSDEKSKAIWEAECGGKIFCSHGTKHSKAVMTLFNPKYDIEVERFEKDNCGRLVILDTKINGSNLILVNVYAPKEIAQQVQFFEKINNKLLSYVDENILIGGDFNCPLTAFDKIGGRPVENKKKQSLTRSQTFYPYICCTTYGAKKISVRKSLPGEIKLIKYSAD